MVKIFTYDKNNVYLQWEYIYIGMNRFDKSLIKALTSTYKSKLWKLNNEIVNWWIL